MPWRPILAMTLAGLAQAADAPPSPASSASAAQAAPDPAAELATWAARAVELGFPDCAGASLVLGRVVISPAPSSSASAAVQAPGQPPQQSNQNGLHAHLADGSWLINLRHRVDPGWTVDASRTKAIAIGEVWTKAAVRRGGAPDADRVRQWLERYPEAARPLISAAMPQLALMSQLGLDGNDRIEAPLALLALARAGVGQVETLASASAWIDHQDYGDSLASYLAGTPDPVSFAMSTGAYGPRAYYGMHRGRGMRLGEDGEAPAAQPGPGSLATVFGRALHVAARRRLCQGFALGRVEAWMAPADAGRMADAALATLPGGAAASLGADIAALRAGSALPRRSASGAALADRVASWNPLASAPDFMDGEGEGLPMGGETAEAATFSVADFDDLLGLLEDGRPSRWLDLAYQPAGGTPRSLGDNAWRALASVIGCDPRLLIGRPTATPWTATERQEAAAALRAWWAARKAKGLGAALAEAAPGLDAEALLSLLHGLPAAQRPPVFAALATAWTAPPAWEAQPFAQLLGMAKDEAAFGQRVATWPVQDGLRSVLAVWHDRQGRGEHLAAWLDSLLASKPERTDELGTALWAIGRSPKPEILARLQGLLAGDLEAWPAKGMVAAICFYGIDGGQLSALDGEDGEHFSSRRAFGPDGPAVGAGDVLPGWLAWSLLIDERPLPKGWIDKDGDLSIPDYGGRGFGGRGERQAGAAPAADLRVCDFAALAIAGNAWQFGLGMDGRLELPDVFAPIDQREVRIEAVRAALGARLRKALAAAGLPETLPESARRRGDEHALF